MATWQNLKTRMPSGEQGWFARFYSHIVAAFAQLQRAPRNVPKRLVAQFSTTRIVLVAIVLAIATVWEAALFDVPAIVFSRDLPDWIVELARFVSAFGRSSYFLWPLGLSLVAFAAFVASAKPSPLAQRVVASVAIRFEFLFLAIAAPTLFTNIIKRIIGRARPFVGGEADAFYYHPFSWSAAFASMPSNHATTAFAVAVAAGSLWPRLRGWLWCYAVVIALSRVVMIAHHPSDVVVGVVIGTCGALLVRNLFANRRLAFAVTPEGEVRGKPGPTWRQIRKVFVRR